MSDPEWRSEDVIRLTITIVALLVIILRIPVSLPSTAGKGAPEDLGVGARRAPGGLLVPMLGGKPCPRYLKV